MTRFCANCGTEVDDNAVFCPTCGQPCKAIECYAVRGKVRRGEMMRGKSDPRPPNVLDTTPLAEGVPYETWYENESARLAKVLNE